ncbi:MULTISPECIES: general stress protein [unclassified Actinomyces]|uniref:general stress protein n=1 Tax=unclassified Actinomyces TaxID=2609248 RepID=UPI002017A43C|nr:MULTISPECIES: general stress protein [unclassified Actinomyces]
MSQPMSAHPATRARTMPQGEEVASFATYPQAQAAVDSLSDDGFPVQHLAIVGTDLRQVENITGRMSWGRAVASGTASGLWLGALVGVMLSFFGNASAGGAGFLAAVLLGVVWGILFQVVGYALTRGRRDFTSTSSVIASRYSIIAAHQASQAAQALAQAPGNLTRGGAAARRAEERRAAREAARAAEPTAFGSRPDERPRFGVRISDVGADGGVGPGADGAAPGSETSGTSGAPSDREA